MDLQRALEIIGKLADGCHPASGETLPEDSIFQDPQTIRALHRAVQALENESRKQHARKSLPRNAGKPWNEEEEMRLKEELRSGLSLEEIAATHDRRLGSIVARLLRIRNHAHPAQRL